MINLNLTLYVFFLGCGVYLSDKPANKPDNKTTLQSFHSLPRYNFQLEFRKYNAMNKYIKAPIWLIQNS